MSKSGKVEEERARYKFALERVSGSVPCLKPIEKRDYRAKVFKSGNSLALRLPADLGLSPGMEMNLRVEGHTFTFEPVDAPKRRFAIDKVWGSATGLELIKPADRVFEEPKLPTSDAQADDQR